MTFNEIRSKSINAAQNLQSRGYKKDQIFSIIATNSHHLSPIVFAGFYLGCPINSLDPTFGKMDMKHMLSTTTPALVFCDANIYDLVKECLTELKNNAKIFTFGKQIGDSEPVESLFVNNVDEYEFMWVRTWFD